MTNFKKIFTAAAAVVTLTAAVAATAAPAEARWGRGGAFAAGAAVGLLATGVAAHAYHHRAPRYGYVEHGGSCWRERREVYNRFGDFVGYRSIRVCN